MKDFSLGKLMAFLIISLLVIIVGAVIGGAVGLASLGVVKVFEFLFKDSGMEQALLSVTVITLLIVIAYGVRFITLKTAAIKHKNKANLKMAEKLSKAINDNILLRNNNKDLVGILKEEMDLEALTGTITGLVWQSDWNGYEVGYPEIDVVGLYSSELLKCDMYINAENGMILEIMLEED